MHAPLLTRPSEVMWLVRYDLSSNLSAQLSLTGQVIHVYISVVIHSGLTYLLHVHVVYSYLKINKQIRGINEQIKHLKALIN